MKKIEKKKPLKQPKTSPRELSLKTLRAVAGGLSGNREDASK